MRDLGSALTPAGTGTDRVLSSWQQLARHADTPCEGCQQAVRGQLTANQMSGELLDGCCDAGQALIRAWQDACGDLVDHLIALQ